MQVGPPFAKAGGCRRAGIAGHRQWQLCHCWWGAAEEEMHSEPKAHTRQAQQGRRDGADIAARIVVVLTLRRLPDGRRQPLSQNVSCPISATVRAVPWARWGFYWGEKVSTFLAPLLHFSDWAPHSRRRSPIPRSRVHSWRLRRKQSEKSSSPSGVLPRVHHDRQHRPLRSVRRYAEKSRGSHVICSESRQALQALDNHRRRLGLRSILGFLLGILCAMCHHCLLNMMWSRKDIQIFCSDILQIVYMFVRLANESVYLCTFNSTLYIFVYD